MLTSPLGRDEKIYESRLIDFLYVTLRDSVFNGSIHYSFIRPGFADDEIMRAIIHERMQKRIESGAGSSAIKSALMEKKHSAEEIQDAFVFFNVNMSLKKGQPLREIQRSLLKIGVSPHDINRAVLFSTFLGLENDHPRDAAIKMLLKKGWKRKDVKRAVLYTFLRRTLKQADTTEPVTKEEVTTMVSDLKKIV